MVSVRSVVIALVALIALTLPPAATADTNGPACWNMIVPPPGAGSPSASPFVLLFTNINVSTDPAIPSTATVAGVNRFGGPGFPPPVSGAALEAAGLVSMVLTVAPSSGQSPRFVNVQFQLSTLLGQGHCTGGSATCGDGKTITWVPMSFDSIP